ncbi:armadillo repeat-containing protein 5 [Microdochium nivale]|nr:armadillo repeat-containing protein 5 [Microdochium nivale]
MPANPIVHVVDERGDLMLHVGDATAEGSTTAKFQVCSRTMARSSSVFARMLFGRFMEAKPASPDEEWKVNLPDDDVDTMEQLLHLMHGNFSHFKLGSDFDSTKDIKALYNFFVAADKYDCTTLAQPWTQLWLSVVQKMTMMDHEMCLMFAWIYYQIGHKKLYESVVEKLVWETQQDTAASFPVVVPPSMLDNMLQNRQKKLTVIMQPVKNCIEVLTGPNAEKENYCRSERAGYYDNYGNIGSRKDCTDRIYGAVLRQLIQANLWPLPETSNSSLTPQELKNVLRSINTASEGGFHSQCVAFSPGSDASDLKNCIYTASDQEIEYMAMQAKKTGLKTA